MSCTMQGMDRNVMVGGMRLSPQSALRSGAYDLPTWDISGLPPQPAQGFPGVTQGHQVGTVSERDMHSRSNDFKGIANHYLHVVHPVYCVDTRTNDRSIQPWGGRVEPCISRMPDDSDENHLDNFAVGDGKDKRFPTGAAMRLRGVAPLIITPKQACPVRDQAIQGPSGALRIRTDPDAMIWQWFSPS
jgi:hypothetical protein